MMFAAQDALFGEVEFSSQLSESLRNSRPVKVLEESLARGRLAHAMLFHGADIDALEQVALALAGTLLKAAPGSVRLHPDLLTLRPSGKARQIKVGERGEPAENTMRRFLRDIHQTANQGGRKVAVLYEADRLNAATANAFLKTLEEPPADTVILLLSTRPYDLLDTIRSRCFSFRIEQPFAPMDDPVWLDWVEAYHDWLKVLRSTPRRGPDVADAVMRLYGLVVRFESALESLSDAAWEREKEQLPSHLPDEQQAAHEVGLRKSVRSRLFRDIEQVTRNFALDAGTASAARPLARAVAELEHAVLLSDVFNMKEDAALEAFLLASLRIWAIDG